MKKSILDKKRLKKHLNIFNLISILNILFSLFGVVFILTRGEKLLEFTYMVNFFLFFIDMILLIIVVCLLTALIFDFNKKLISVSIKGLVPIIVVILLVSYQNIFIQKSDKEIDTARYIKVEQTIKNNILAKNIAKKIFKDPSKITYLEYAKLYLKIKKTENKIKIIKMKKEKKIAKNKISKLLSRGKNEKNNN